MKDIEQSASLDAEYKIEARAKVVDLVHLARIAAAVFSTVCFSPHFTSHRMHPLLPHSRSQTWSRRTATVVLALAPASTGPFFTDLPARERRESASCPGPHRGRRAINDVNCKKRERQRKRGTVRRRASCTSRNAMHCCG
jgi:hypothetical protein